jgi:mevalonate kinase
LTRKNIRDNELLRSARVKTSSKVYAVLIKLVREDREDLAEIILKIDRILELASICIKHRDYNEANENLNSAKSKIDMLKGEGVDTEYLDYLYEGILKKAKR